MEWLNTWTDRLWEPWLLGLFLFTGLWYSAATGFFQLFGLRRWLKATLGKLLRPSGSRETGGLSQTQALATALASTIGTGSIAGVATAIFYGGPGAVFWMWVSALLGMMTSCAEKTLAVRYRERAPGGGWQGGPMCYMARGLGRRGMAALFSLCCVGASLAGGNLVQANSISTALRASLGWDPLAVGLGVALACGAVILGGVGRWFLSWPCSIWGAARPCSSPGPLPFPPPWPPSGRGPFPPGRPWATAWAPLCAMAWPGASLPTRPEWAPLPWPTPPPG